jgi:cholesterol transport system auxiliary component
VAAIAAAVLLAACGPLVQIGGNAKPPGSLLTLRATAQPGGPQRTGTIGIEVPGVPGPLQTLRLPVVTADTQVTYLAGAIWAEQPNKQFQRVLADTLAARGFQTIDLHQSNIAPARRLTGQLLDFGVDVRDPAATVVRVRYDAQLTAPLRLQRFDASEPVPSLSPEAVAAALNRAANRVAGQVADWAQ